MRVIKEEMTRVASIGRGVTTLEFRERQPGGEEIDELGVYVSCLDGEIRVRLGQLQESRGSKREGMGSRLSKPSSRVGTKEGFTMGREPSPGPKAGGRKKLKTLARRARRCRLKPEIGKIQSRAVTRN